MRMPETGWRAPGQQLHDLAAPVYLEEDRETADAALSELEFDIRRIRAAKEAGHWDGPALTRACQEAAERFQSLPELMAREAA